MPQTLPSGPYRTLQLADGQAVPYYIIPFDKRGVCVGPKTRAHLTEATRAGRYTDIFLFSHGWNNDWTAATERYEDFLKGYVEMRATHDLPMPTGYKPLLVGVFWPSTVLAFGESEKGPAIAAGDPAAMDQQVAEELEEVAMLSEDLDAANAERFYELAQKDALNSAEAVEFADILRQVYAVPDDELGEDDSVSTEELVEAWAQAQAKGGDLDDFGTVDAADDDDPQAAFIGGLIKKLDPRPAIRLATVYKMKDRAGKVGARGVSGLLSDLLEAGNARLHLIGHSYGGKVMLSATAIAPLPRGVESMLLLQPAVSHLCFADRVPGTNRSGGYRPVLERVNKPILSTFSRHDFPLTKTFHLALRRKKDLGEAQIAAGEPPSVYAALGGFGPRGCKGKLIDIQSVNDVYDLDPDVKIFGLRGDEAIGGHGDISNEATWWALYTLASR